MIVRYGGTRQLKRCFIYACAPCSAPSGMTNIVPVVGVADRDQDTVLPLFSLLTRVPVEHARQYSSAAGDVYSLVLACQVGVVHSESVGTFDLYNECDVVWT